MPCRYAKPSEDAYIVENDKSAMHVGAGPMLCTWGQDTAPDQLVSVPRWLQRNALAGHLLKYPDDCMGCPCFSELG